ncbi:hypothetical protein AB1286_27365 [Trinickia sp. NRRL B-1857]|uniref:hypothetical protein n=1 Tax=Trinickia sp. NRRL B-1857 TaxID=3162879 RepID=UPI003D2805F7
MPLYTPARPLKVPPLTLFNEAIDPEFQMASVLELMVPALVKVPTLTPVPMFRFPFPVIAPLLEITQSPELQLTADVVGAVTEQAPVACTCAEAIAANAAAIASTTFFCLGLRMLWLFIIYLAFLKL